VQRVGSSAAKRVEVKAAWLAEKMAVWLAVVKVEKMAEQTAD
jgi:hypothetical protein